jgi:hypothetical protein
VTTTSCAFSDGEVSQARLALLAAGEDPRGYLAGVSALAEIGAIVFASEQAWQIPTSARADLLAAAARSRQRLLQRVERDVRREALRRAKRHAVSTRAPR